MCLSKPSKPNSADGADGLPDLLFIDFGISKLYKTAKGFHIAEERGKTFVGTAEFTSLSGHNKRGQSRRDDLESIGLMLIYFLRGGNLPWSKLNKAQVDGDRLERN